MRTIENYAERIRAKHALFLFDSCFSGKLVSRSEIEVPPNIVEEVTLPVRQFITAGAANQTVPDESIFRRLFERGLDGAADEDKDGYILGSELARYLKREVTNYSNRSQTPQYSKILNLDLNQGDFVFVVPGKQAFRTQTSPTPSLAQGESTNRIATEVQKLMTLDNILISLRRDLLTLGQRNEVLIRVVKERSITFKLTPKEEQQLENAGASKALIEAIQQESSNNKPKNPSDPDGIKKRTDLFYTTLNSIP
jgi:hypothetical protein